MKRNVLILVVSLLSMVSQVANAQCVVKGKVVEQGTGTPLAYTNVVVYALPDTTFVKGTTSGDDGSFEISDVPEEALVRMSMLGYTSKERRVVGGGDMGDIPLAAEVTALKEVVVKADAVRFDNRGLVANIEQTPLAKIGSLNDMLGQLPFITTDGKDVKVFGRGAPIYYVDNRRILRQEELKRIVPSRIKKVEIIMTPGPEYPSGTESVIRITTIRKQGDGWSGMLFGQLTGKNRVGEAVFADLNYRVKRWDFFGNLQYAHAAQHERSEEHLAFGKRSVDSRNDANNKMSQLGGAMGFNYTADNGVSAGLKYDYMLHPKQNVCRGTAQTESFYEGSRRLERSWDADYSIRQNYHLVNGYYRHEMPKRRLFQADVDMLHINGLYGQDKYFVKERKTLLESNHFNSWLYAGKAVYGFPLWGMDMKIGGEVSRTRIDADNGIVGTLKIAMSSSKSVSEQNNYALFWDGYIRLKDFSLSLGLRAEHINFNYYSNNKYDADASYTSTLLYPSVVVAYTKGSNRVSLSYDYSVARPTYRQLNNSTSFVSDYVYEVGNPLLRSANIHKLGLVASFGKLKIMANGRFSRNRLLTSYFPLEQVDSVLALRTINLHTYKSLSFGAAYGFQLGAWRPTVEASYSQQFITFQGGKFDKPLYKASVKNMVVLPKDTYVFCNILYSSLAHDGLNNSHQQFRVDMNISKALAKNKWNLNLSVTDLFNTYSNRKRMQTADVLSWSVGNNTMRKVEFTVSYSFNNTRSKFRGTGAGNEEQRRM